MTQSDLDRVFEDTCSAFKDFLCAARSPGQFDERLLLCHLRQLESERISQRQNCSHRNTPALGAWQDHAIKTALRYIAGFDVAWHETNQDGLSVLEMRRQNILFQ